jgi:type IV pilus assembly protein PilC
MVVPEHRHRRLHSASLRILLIFVIPSFKNDVQGLRRQGRAARAHQNRHGGLEAFVGQPAFFSSGSIAGSVVGVSYTYKTPRGRSFFHRMLLRLPIMGPSAQDRRRALHADARDAALVGRPILDALEIVAKTAGNVVVEEAIMYARQKISEGKNMAGPLTETNVFPPMVVQMVGVGEQTGALDTMLNKIADFYEDEVDVAGRRADEPHRAGHDGRHRRHVGVVLIAMYLPIFSIAGKIKAE